MNSNLKTRLIIIQQKSWPSRLLLYFMDKIAFDWINGLISYMNNTKI